MEYQVKPEEAGRKVRDILRRSMGVSYTAMKSAKWNGRIRLNGVPAHTDLPTQAGDRISSRGCKAGLALKPGSSLEMITGWLDQTDLVLMMTVEPGFGGQKLDERVIGKIRSLKELGYRGEIEADGGITEANLGILAENGLTVAVMGTALFRNKNMKECIQRLHRIGLNN